MTDTELTTAAPSLQSQSALRSYAVPLTFAMAGFVAFVAGIVMLLSPKSSAEPVEPEAAVAITAQVEKFVIAYNTYDTTKNVRRYTRTFTALVTDDLANTLERDAADAYEKLASTRQKSSQARVKAVGVESLAESTARVVVAVDRTVSGQGLDQPTQVRPRGVVTLKKVDDEWLVSAYDPVRTDSITDPGGPITDAGQDADERRE